MVGNGLNAVGLGVPRHVHEERDGVLHRLQVANVENPHTLDTVVVGQRQLFEHLLRLCDVEPLRVARRSHVVNVVVDAPATLAGPLLRRHGHTADVAPVVVADENHHIVGHLQSGIIVVLYLFIECPHLRGLLCWFLRHLLDDAALIGNDAVHQLRVGLVAHGLVAVAAHADGHDVLGTIHALDALTEELVELRLVRLVVPGTPLAAVTGILLVVTGHRLVV